jgi:hypothetical protein
MLSFVDLPKGIRFVRIEHEDDIVKRTTLGRVSKATYEIEPAMAKQLSSGEREEVDDIIAGYLESEIEEKRFYALTLPVILRKALEYLEEDATEIEKKFIMGAVLEAVRRMRKLERDVSAG